MPIIKYRDPITKEMVELPIKFDPADGSIDITKFDPELQNILTSQIIRSYTEPEGIQEGRLWLDMNTTDFQGTAFDQLSSRITNLESRKLVTAETLNVGPGGEFNTINEALVYATTKYPVYVAGDVKAELVINLKSGFVMAEQVIVKGLNLGWIRITGEDAETTIQRSALTQLVNSWYPCFFGSNSAILPSIEQPFILDASGSATGKIGLMLRDGASANFYGGIKNVPAYGCLITRRSSANIAGADFSGAGTIGVYVLDSSTVEAAGAKINNAGTLTTSYGLYAGSNSRVNFISGEAKDCTGTAILATYNASVNAASAVATGAGLQGMLSSALSRINAYGANARKGETNSVQDIVVSTGGTISAMGATGGVSQTINTITSAGIIFM